jgi:hypothetical protein
MPVLVGQGPCCFHQPSAVLMRFVVGQVLCCCHQQGTSLRGLCGLLLGVEFPSMTFYSIQQALDDWIVDCG